MLPNNNETYISEVKKEFIYLNNTLYDPLISYERGGFSLGNPSLGLTYQIWTLKFEEKKFILNNELGFELVLKELDVNDTITVKKVSLLILTLVKLSLNHASFTVSLRKRWR